MLWKLALPSVIIVIGLSIIISQLKNKKVDANIPIDCNKQKIKFIQQFSVVMREDIQMKSLMVHA